jgi:hypothetical protein
MKYLVNLLIIVLFSFVSLISFAESEIAWDPSKPIKIGSGVDLRFFGEALNECLEYDTEFETLGANSTTSEIKVVDNYEELINELKYGVDIEISTKAEWASYKANDTFKVKHELDNYKKSENHTLNILVHIKADYGKRLAKNYKLKNNFQSLVDKKDFSSFVKSCGTHIVVGERRQSQVALVLSISELTKDSKRIIKNSYEQNGGFSGNIKGVDVSINSKTSIKWSELIKRASKYGSVTASIKSSGGVGISELEKLAPAMVGDLPLIMTKLSEYSSTFSQETSAITHYLLISTKSFGVTQEPVDFHSFYTMRGLIKKLLSLESLISELEIIKAAAPHIFQKHYKDDYVYYKSVKSTISSFVDKCLDENECKDYDKNISNFNSLNDFIIDENLSTLCSYRQFETTLTDGTKKSLNVLANVRVYVEGKLRMYEDIKLDSSKPYYLTDNGDITATPFRGLKVGNKEEITSDVFSSISNTPIDLNRIIDTSTSVSSLNKNKLMKIKDEIDSRSYFIEVRLKNGAVLRDYLGYANFDKCPITKEI